MLWAGRGQQRFSHAAAPVERPLPLWILYPLFFVAVYCSHWTLLRLPYYWDEAGYYIPAALDFYRTGALIPYSTVTNAHPPLPSILLAAWWHLSGFVPSATRTAVAMVAAAALLGVFRLSRLLAGATVASVVTMLTALYPVWFAQSTLAHADIFAAAFTLWALSFYLEDAVDTTRKVRPGRMLLGSVLFALAALSKETAIVTPLVLAAWEAVRWMTEPSDRRAQSAAWMAALLAPVVPLAMWYVYHYTHTGFMFGNPEFLRYNATANLGVLRVLLSLWHRMVHLTVHMNLYVPVLATVAVLLMPRLAGRGSAATTQPVLMTLGVVVVGNALAFSVLGGALLTRYLLPLYPLVLLACVATWRERLHAWWGLALLTAAAFLAGLWVNPPYSFAPEDNLTYRDMVVLHQQAIAYIRQHDPGATVLTAWPATAELAHPELGYTRQSVAVTPIDNFSYAQIEKAAANPGAFETALVFSTKWAPSSRFSLGHATETTDTRYFDFHRDLPAAEVARLLGGEVVWQAQRNGEWAAVLRFPRAAVAALL